MRKSAPAWTRVNIAPVSPPAETPATTPEPRAWRRLAGSRVFRQTALYTGAGGASMLLGGVAKAILAGQLEPAAYGTYEFAASLLMLLALVFDFGLIMSAARRLARGGERLRRELVGASMVAFAPLGLAFGVLVFGLSFVVDDVFSTNAGDALRISSPLAFVWAFPLVGELIGKGADRLHVFSFSQLAGRVAFVSVLAGLAALGADLSVTFALLLSSGGLLVSTVAFALWQRPRLARTGEHLRSFASDVRAWSFNQYVGRLFSIGTYNMDVLMVAGFADAESTGYYALASALTGLMSIPMTGLGAALYPRMAHRPRIEPRWLAGSWTIGAVGVVGIAFVAPPFIDLLFSDDYAPVAGLAIPLALGQAVRGVTSVYSNFLSSHGQGRSQRNAAFVLTVSNLVLNFALIPPFGATGAAWASFFALLANFAGYQFYYRRYVGAAA